MCVIVSLNDSGGYSKGRPPSAISPINASMRGDIAPR